MSKVTWRAWRSWIWKPELSVHRDTDHDDSKSCALGLCQFRFTVCSWLLLPKWALCQLPAPAPPSPGQCRLIVLSGWGLGRASQFGQLFSGQSQSTTETAGWPYTLRFLKSSQPLSPVRHSISQHGVSIRHFMLSQASPNYNWFWRVFAGAVKFFICPPSEAVFYFGERAPCIPEKKCFPWSLLELSLLPHFIPAISSLFRWTFFWSTRILVLVIGVVAGWCVSWFLW